MSGMSSVTWEGIALNPTFNTLNISRQAPAWSQVVKLEYQFLLGRHTAHVKMQI
jgi:hypothetical protein